ncbi:MAG TPA: PhzF family phenazine biosynthesis protein [Rhizomicrobium sp.]|nr:PhzF family phenazine biosynthesis protein [Rhizomicrobium sp.]
MPQSVRFLQVVTFAADPQHGNPAFVLMGVGEANERQLTAACAMLRTDIIAVVEDGAGDEIPLRFFTTAGSHPGAGHATLAAAHAVLRGGVDGGMNATRAVNFRQTNGESRAAHIEGERISIGFPAMPATRLDRIGEMETALGARPRETWVAPFGYVAVFDDRASVAALRPNLTHVSSFDRNAVIATAPGDGTSDIVIRVFAPKVGLPEDPVCGTAHRIIVPYWAKTLGKTSIHSRQISERGGDLWCEDKTGTVAIAGQTCLVLEGIIRLPEA